MFVGIQRAKIAFIYGLYRNASALCAKLKLIRATRIV